MPKKFVLKTTNGCGTNIICNDKRKINKNEVLKKLENWLKIDHSLKHAEMHYSYITPRIICEKYIETNDGLLPNDYKIFCFNGEPKIILLVNDRKSGKHSREFFDLDWNSIKLEKTKNNKINANDYKAEKPKSLERMIYYAKRLSRDIPFVRVDFYDDKKNPIFGELTFTPAAGLSTYFTEEAEIMLGNWIDLPDKDLSEYNLNNII